MSNINIRCLAALKTINCLIDVVTQYDIYWPGTNEVRSKMYMDNCSSVLSYHSRTSIQIKLQMKIADN